MIVLGRQPLDKAKTLKTARPKPDYLAAVEPVDLEVGLIQCKDLAPVKDGNTASERAARSNFVCKSRSRRTVFTIHFFFSYYLQMQL